MWPLITSSKFCPHFLVQGVHKSDYHNTARSLDFILPWVHRKLHFVCLLYGSVSQLQYCVPSHPDVILVSWSDPRCSTVQKHQRDLCQLILFPVCIEMLKSDKKLLWPTILNYCIGEPGSTRRISILLLEIIQPD